MPKARDYEMGTPQAGGQSLPDGNPALPIFPLPTYSHPLVMAHFPLARVTDVLLLPLFPFLIVLLTLFPMHRTMKRAGERDKTCLLHAPRA